MPTIWPPAPPQANRFRGSTTCRRGESRDGFSGWRARSGRLAKGRRLHALAVGLPAPSHSPSGVPGTHLFLLVRRVCGGGAPCPMRPDRVRTRARTGAGPSRPRPLLVAGHGSTGRRAGPWHVPAGGAGPGHSAAAIGPAEGVGRHLLQSRPPCPSTVTFAQGGGDCTGLCARGFVHARGSPTARRFAARGRRGGAQC